MKILVTGASGFIGSALIRRVFNERKQEFSGHSFVALVRDTDQRNMARLEMIPARLMAPQLKGRLRYVKGDLTGDISGLCESIDVVINFAAKTFVDHSIRDVEPFLDANVLGTMRLLEDARRCKVKRFFQVSTDEVYGSILEGAYTETAPLNPTNPYSASKAGADCLAISYAHTYGLHTTITRTENNYGPYQHPQKVFPVFVKMALADKPLPVYGDGGHVRQWLWVDDHIDGILHLLMKVQDAPGSVYHIAGNQELSNLELAERILKETNGQGGIKHIPDTEIRPGHDRRYALNCDKLKATGWWPRVNLEEGIQRAVAWYTENLWWMM